jgi:hypothetical protein
MALMVHRFSHRNFTTSKWPCPQISQSSKTSSPINQIRYSRIQFLAFCLSKYLINAINRTLVMFDIQTSHCSYNFLGINCFISQNRPSASTSLTSSAQRRISSIFSGEVEVMVSFCCLLKHFHFWLKFSHTLNFINSRSSLKILYDR